MKTLPKRFVLPMAFAMIAGFVTATDAQTIDRRYIAESSPSGFTPAHVARSRATDSEYRHSKKSFSYTPKSFSSIRHGSSFAADGLEVATDQYGSARLKLNTSGTKHYTGAFVQAIDASDDEAKSDDELIIASDETFGDEVIGKRFFVGAEYLLLRTHFSDSTAYVRRFGPITRNNVTTTYDEWVPFSFEYESSFRTFIGYRFEDCNTELRLTYTRLFGDDSIQETTTSETTPTRWEIQPGNGDTMTATSELDGNVYDLEFSKRFPLGDDCESCCCSPWDLRWSAGVRIADMGYKSSVFTNDPTDGRGDVVMDFIGAGLIAGLQGRRYVNDSRCFSIYSSLDVAMLVGQFDHRLDRVVQPVGVNPLIVESFISSSTRTVPVTELEIGVSWNPTDRLTLSTGWFVHAWWDLGMTEDQTSSLLGNGAEFFRDDSNIMSFDGFKFSAEFAF